MSKRSPAARANGVSPVRCLIVSATVFALVFAANSAAGKACVWKVTAAKGEILYLGGSIHALRSTDYPLPIEYNRAFDASERLVFEVEPDAFPSLDQRRDKIGVYPRGDNIKNHIDPRTYEYLQRLFARLSLPETVFSQYRPWYLALRMRLPGKSGLLLSLGVESYLGGRAKANHKPISGLESGREHLDVFSGLTDRQGEAILLIDLIRYQERSHLAESVQTWRRGDADAIARDTKKDYADFPAFGERIINARNRNWIPRIEKDLHSGHVYFVVAGAAHMGGPDGVLALLKARGYQIEQL